jgi:uncharacterized membrane protein
MLLAAQIILIIAGIFLLIDAFLMITHRPNFIKSWPLPCPNTLILLGVGVILLSIAGF